jgi:hypothetical protein
MAPSPYHRQSQALNYLPIYGVLVNKFEDDITGISAQRPGGTHHRAVAWMLYTDGIGPNQRGELPPKASPTAKYLLAN